MKIRSSIAVTSAAVKNAVVSGTRAFSAERNLRGRPRPSSFPFVSGDTFRAVADFVFDIAVMRKIHSGKIPVPGFPRAPSIVFVELNVLDVDEWRDFVDDWLRSARDVVPGNVVIAHNGDRAPRQLLEEWSNQGNVVFAQNAFDDFAGVIPIPIGLQNPSHRKAGVLDDFLLFQDSLREGSGESHERKQLVFASFNISNRPDARGELAGLIDDSPFHYEKRRISGREFRRRLLTSKFVLSPPGAGPDCHRTWEALILGAVPVILRSTLADSLQEGTGIHAVESWQDFLNSDPDELHSLWRSKRRHSIEKVLFSHWLEKINSARSSLEVRANSTD